MAKMNLYNVYLEDSVTETVTKHLVPAFSKQEANYYLNGSDELIAIKEAEPIPISSAKLLDTLIRDGWGDKERNIIIHALSQIEIIQ